MFVATDVYAPFKKSVKRLKGFLNYNVNYQLAENDDFYELNEQESGMSTEVHYNGEKYVFSTALQIGIPQTYITLNVTRKFTDPVGKIKASFRYERNKKICM